MVGRLEMSRLTVDQSTHVVLALPNASRILFRAVLQCDENVSHLEQARHFVFLENMCIHDVSRVFRDSSALVTAVSIRPPGEFLLSGLAVKFPLHTHDA